MAEFINKIYNQETKERFMESLDLAQYPPRWWERVFEKTYIFEEEAGKDLYNFTVPEILAFYKFLDIGTLSPLIIYNTNLIKYGQWAMNQNLLTDGQNHFDEIDFETLTTCISIAKAKGAILDYKNFLYIVNNKIVNDQDKYVFFCIFEGIKGKDYQDIIDLKMSDINEKDKTVTVGSGRTLPVSQEFIDICKAADQQKQYYNLTDSLMTRDLVPSITIFKEKHNSRGVDLNRTVYNTISRNIKAIDELSDVVTAKSLRDSGMIYYLRQRAEKLGITVPDLIYSIDNWRDIADKYQFNTEAKSRWLLQYRDILQ